MRRKEREVIEEKKIEEVILSCHCCRLGFSDRGEVYIVPLNFGYTSENGKKIFYFHSAKEGRKIELISSSASVGFELDTNYHLVEGPTACAYTACFQSIIGTGRITILKEQEQKKAALQAILHHNTGISQWEIPADSLSSVCVFQLEVEQLCCKQHL